ncbi:restriction endonuclease S subunit [Aequorivita sublithincola DSM 14238]|uniref:Restriction endonuclease S subunit n=1 Tax=Aequorivita sublithincola (strain DSM 14238 / LMG 21431 / ACAM 643 / 9-3) TaxID=746697 RepID=I3YVW5_AEQSU|nr:restriction endonuclease subunit S [Aequorivita sublithincola]AFL81133.1 restriction endonuclease S subunit [Aequorivita sublithincola DSM 14238]
MTSEKLLIDKTNWTPVKFGDVVFEPKESSKDPIADGIEHVVGLEHIESENIHLRNSANLDTSTTFTKKFKVGDVLFGRRRAYLKKAAQASFSGICSGDITVFRAKKNLIPELLPFIVNNEKFFDYAIKHSAGGLSPRVKFKDLANYEFLLPPIDQQDQLAELLWAMDKVIESEKGLVEKTEIIKSSLFKKFSGLNKDWRRYKIDELMNFHYGSSLKESDRIAGDYSVITSSGFQGTHKEYLCEGPGIVVGRKGNVGQVTWVNNNFWTTDTAYYIQIKPEFEDIPIKFFYYLLKAANLKRHSIATAVPGLNRDDALMTKVYLPNRRELFTYLEKFELLDEKLLVLESKLSCSKSLQKSLINQVF